jgi:hypothetical protein
VKRRAVLALAAALTTSLAGCGRKAAPEAPPDVDARYPRNYPGSGTPRPAAVNPPPGPGNDEIFIPRTTP